MFSIEIINYGVQSVPGPQVYYQSGWDEWVSFNFYFYLLRGEGVTGLIDCGMDDPDPLNRAIVGSLGQRGEVKTLAPGKLMMELLSRHGVSVEEIDFVAITHLHADHVSNARQFPNARFLISQQGWERFHILQNRQPKMVADPSFPRSVIEAFENDLKGRLDVVPDGLTEYGIGIKHIGGHTAESTAFTVTTDSGEVVIPGDTVWTYRNLEENIPVGSCIDLFECYQAMDWVRNSGDIVLPSHDPLVLERYPNCIL